MKKQIVSYGVWSLPSGGRITYILVFLSSWVPGSLYSFPPISNLPFCYWNLLNFGFVSSFVLRISNLMSLSSVFLNPWLFFS